MLHRRFLPSIVGCLPILGASLSDPNADRDALPGVPPGFEVAFFAREPLVRQPCSMAFDARGRLCVGMGPQYRNPAPETPGDSVVFVLDGDGDGRAERTAVFATGFNAIQGLAWHGRDLWVANAPDLTVVRDLDGDDVADEYVRVYTDLGNLEHGLHGLNWAPDGRLYMSKGNSKGLTQPGHIAPRAFRELWGVSAPAGTPDLPPARIYRKGEYRHAYHDPADDWGKEGGILRCDDGGLNLEIVARGCRNPWDITFDSGFNWLGTDNDQTMGDRVLMPFQGANFGWNHPWSAHWSDEPHPPSAPVSGPLFEGSGTGIVFGDTAGFPATHRGVFFINDWLRKTTFVWRPRWEGALLRPVGGTWEPFVMGGSSLYRPTDLEFGPDGALWVLGWSSGYGAEYAGGQMSSEGRVFRVFPQGQPAGRQLSEKRARHLREWTLDELVEDFDGPLPVWRIDAQDELVRRGDTARRALMARLSAGNESEARVTWMMWALGRMQVGDRALDEWFAGRVGDASTGLNLRLQAIRIVADRLHRAPGAGALPQSILNQLDSREPRLRFEAVQAIGQARSRAALPGLFARLAEERDPTIFYAGWQVLRGLSDTPSLRGLLADSRPGLRKAALLALLEDHTLSENEVRRLAADPSADVAALASTWLAKAAAGGEAVELRGRPLRPPPPASAGPTPSVPGEGLARNIRTRSRGAYRLIQAGLRPGSKPYTDRAYTLKHVPAPMLGFDLLQTANEDDGSQGDDWLTFESVFAVRVHVAFDTRAAQAPRWLRDGFRRTAQRIQADHWEAQVYSRDFPAGTIRLGGNTDDGRGGGKGHYFVALEPLLAPVPGSANPTRLDSTLVTLAQGNPERGEWLFHHPLGPGCFNCHALAGHGNAFGPDLSAVGDRATARHIAQSILEPNAVITEGFNLQSVETPDGETSGVLIEESGLSLTLGLADGRREVIPKSGVKSRRTLPGSAMPPFDTILPPESVADLTTFLLAQSTRKPAASPPQPTSPAVPVPGGFHVEERSDRLMLSHSGLPLAEFVFRDERILRPYFSNLKAPGGMAATRRHPPVAGVDAVDHDTMHPGLWLGFGDISGTDFWRNRGRIEHIRFARTPTVEAGRLLFETESALHTPDGRNLCALDQRFSIEALTNAWLVAWEATFRDATLEVVFGDQEEMGFGARVATPLTEKSGGRILSSAGRRTAKATWGQPSDWCDYAAAGGGQWIGITLMADPRNFRASWWHNRDYGVFVANPFGRAAMNQGERSAVTLRPGDRLRLRFGAAVHAGETESAWNPAAAFRRFSEPQTDR